MSRLIVRDLYRTLMRASRFAFRAQKRAEGDSNESCAHTGDRSCSLRGLRCLYWSQREWTRYVGAHIRYICDTWLTLYPILSQNSVLSGSTVRKLIRSQFKRNAVDPDPGALEDAFDAARYATERKAAFDMEGAPTSLPAFVYSSPMLPGSVIPLRLFEPRYKAMIRKAMDTDRKFLYVFQDFKTLGLDGVATGLGLVDKVGMVVTIDECRFHEDETVRMRTTDGAMQICLLTFGTHSSLNPRPNPPLKQADIVGIAGPRVRVTHEVSSETYDGNPLYELGYAREADECEDEKEMKEVRTLSDQCSEILHDIYKYWPRFAKCCMRNRLK